MSDPARYRTKEEVDQMKAKDPILLFQDKLLKDGVMTEAEFAQLDDRAKKAAQEAVEHAEASPDPELASLYQDVLV
jgi:pyruvate dehydrogenase E1 component alpha subunit